METTTLPQEEMPTNQKQHITPNLWFDQQAEEAVHFYTSIFKNSKTGHLSRYDDASAKASGQPVGSVLTISFELEGQPFLALNGGPHFQFSPATSFTVICETTEEVDSLWSKLEKGGMVMMPLDAYEWSERYGWVQDQFGISWQIMLGNVDEVGQKITPTLLFVGEQFGRAEEALHFYMNVFKESTLAGIAYAGPDEPNPEGAVKHAQFTLNGNVFMIMESAHDHSFGFTEAISFIVNCTTQEELDEYWEQLSAHPESEQCGWLKDRFGVSWQIVPEHLGALISDPDLEKAGRVMRAMLEMQKIDIAQLEAAYEG